MARSNIQRRQDAERQRIAALERSLRNVFAARRPPPDFEKAIADAKEGFEPLIVRDARDWHPKLKTRDAARLRVAAARHLFARYPVPASLERIWSESEGLAACEIKLRKLWYVAVARGDSLYKAGASTWLSRREVHAFLNAPGDLAFDEAFWFAIAAGYTEDRGVALRIARSKISASPRSAIAFWREAARFFAVNPTGRDEINDLCDFFAARTHRDADYSLKGRTLSSLRRAMCDWHRDVTEMARIEALRQRAAEQRGGRSSPAYAGSWEGAHIDNWSWQPTAKEARRRNETYVVVQLVTAEALVIESRAMHHCVSTYAHKCIAGQASIWSLRRFMRGEVDRMVTIELDRHRRAVQVRGFANRAATDEERQVLSRWAKARGIALMV